MQVYLRIEIVLSIYLTFKAPSTKNQPRAITVNDNSGGQKAVYRIVLTNQL